MTQQDTLKKIKKHNNLTTDRQVADYLGLGEKGAIARMKVGKAGKQVYSLCKIISDLLDKMPRGKGSI